MEVAPTDLDAATVMDLETDPAPSLADRLIGDVGHRLTIEPRLKMVAFQADAHSVPLSVFKDVLFLIRNLIQPAAAVGLVDSTGVMVWRSDLDLPSADLHALRDDGTDEYSRVAVSELLEFKGEIEVVVILVSSEIAVSFVGTALADQATLIVDIPKLGAVVDPSGEILAVEEILLNRLRIRKFLDLDIPEPSGITVVLEADVTSRRHAILGAVSPLAGGLAGEPVGAPRVELDCDLAVQQICDISANM